MKILFLSIVSFFLAQYTQAQLTAKTKCPALEVDILEGTVNGLRPNVNPEEIKAKIPCFTEAVEESATAACGGGVYYKDKGLQIFTGRDYVEIDEKFKGKISLPLLGATRSSLFARLGNPKLKDDSWEAYQLQYGTLVLHFNKAQKVNKIQFSTKPSEVLSLCDQ